jgi:hypothetical protein
VKDLQKSKRGATMQNDDVNDLDNEETDFLSQLLDDVDRAKKVLTVALDENKVHPTSAVIAMRLMHLATQKACPELELSDIAINRMTELFEIGVPEENLH